MEYKGSKSWKAGWANQTEPKKLEDGNQKSDFEIGRQITDMKEPFAPGISLLICFNSKKYQLMAPIIKVGINVR